MKLLQSNSFKRSLKKLHPSEKKSLDKAVKALLKNPEIGEAKKGDLRDIRVYKFKHSNLQYLLAYMKNSSSITLIALGAHENFYRDLKNRFK